MPPSRFPPPIDDDSADLHKHIGCIPALFQIFDPQPSRKPAAVACPTLLQLRPADSSLPDTPTTDHLHTINVATRLFDNDSRTESTTPDTSDQRLRWRAKITVGPKIGIITGLLESNPTHKAAPDCEETHRRADEISSDLLPIGEKSPGIMSKISLSKGAGTKDQWEQVWKPSMAMSKEDESKTRKGSPRRWLGGEDSVEEWKASLRALATVEESTGGYQAPRASPRSSSFEQNTFVIPNTAGRISDGIEAPSISVPPSTIHRRSPNVVARLMGLDDPPKTISPAAPPVAKQSSSTEAKLLRQLLQYKPPPPLPGDRPPPTQLPSIRNPAEELHSVASHGNTEGKLRAGLEGMLKRLETLSLNQQRHHVAPDSRPPSPVDRGTGPNQFDTASQAAKIGQRNDMMAPSDRNICGQNESDPLRAAKLQIAKSLIQKAETKWPSPPPTPTKQINHGIPVVVLKQSEGSFQSTSPSNGFHDEIERRLRQLGLQSSEQERKTLKQILEAMHLKGLLRHPEIKPADGVERQELESVTANDSQPDPRQSAPPPLEQRRRDASPASQNRSNRPASPVSEQQARQRGGGDARRAALDVEAAIVIMKPVAKASSRGATTDNRHVSSAENRNSTTGSPRKARGKSDVVTEKHMDGRKSLLVRPRVQSLNIPPAQQQPTAPESRKLSMKIKPGRLRESKNREKSPIAMRFPSPPLSPATPNSNSSSNPPPRLRKSSEFPTPTHEPPKTSESQASQPAPESTPFNTSTDKLVLYQSAPHNDRAFVEATSANIEGESLTVSVDSLSIILDTNSVSKLDVQHSREESQRQEQWDIMRTPCVLQADLPTQSETTEREESEQCSPISVLEAQLSDHELDGSPKMENTSIMSSTDSGRVATDPNVQIFEDKNPQEETSPLQLMQLTSDGTTDSYTEQPTVLSQPLMPKSKPCIEVGNTEQETPSSQPKLPKPESCTDLRYTEQVLEVVGLTDWTDIPTRWLGGGCEIRPSVYTELEEQWDSVEDENFLANDKDLGGELYRKSRQAATRRRLLFDYLNQFLAVQLEWVSLPEPSRCFMGAPRRNQPLLATHIWQHVQRLEDHTPLKSPPGTADHDSLYVLLERDIMQDVDHTDRWCNVQSQSANLVLELGDTILDTIMQELVLEFIQSRDTA